MNREARNEILTEADYERLIRDPVARSAAARESLLLFFGFYFRHYIEYPIADFQKEIFAFLEDDALKLFVLMAFRGSAKTTIVTLAYVIWAVLGRQNAKHILLLSQTVPQARQLLKNIKSELEANDLLRADLGPFVEEENEWNSFSIVIQKYNARITVASMEQNIRGIRHGPYRPDIVICDDIESLESVRTMDGRDKASQWLASDVIPATAKGARVIVVGSKLHEDSILMRLKTNIEDGAPGVFRAYPIVSDDGVIAWPGKYPTLAAIETERQRIGDERSWFREMMLRVLPDEGRVVQPDWIQYYDALPTEAVSTRRRLTGVDLAISEKSQADCTAMVSVTSAGGGEKLRVFVLPNPLNRRMDFPTTVEQATLLSKTLGCGHYTEIYIEDVAYQAALVQQLKLVGLPAKGVKTGGLDKRSRLASMSHLVKSGSILFPRTGAEELIRQIVDFGIEKHDDLADAFVIAVNAAIDQNRYLVRIGKREGYINGDRFGPDGKKIQPWPSRDGMRLF